LERLFPGSVALHFSEQIPTNANLLAAEIEFTSRMVEKRRRDFTHGRFCAREALRALGQPESAIRVGKDREPLWPEGITGSISHSGAVAIATVARKSDLLAIGVDIESADPLEADILKMVCRPGESSINDRDRGKLLFSIKESIYKCIFPQVNFFVDFQEMQVVFHEGNRFTAIPHKPEIDPALINRLCGRYLIANNRIFSSAWITQI